MLRNERGDVFGQIDNVEVKDEDVSVTFASLSKPQTVVLTVLTADGKDVTAQTQISWIDQEGNYMAQGATLAGLPAGYQVNYRVTLSQQLAMEYDTPETTAYTFTDGNNAPVCQLQAIKKVQMAGKVKDMATGLPLDNAVISADLRREVHPNAEHQDRQDRPVLDRGIQRAYVIGHCCDGLCQ